MNHRHIPIVWLAVTLLAPLVMSCTRRENVAYSHFEQIGTEGWDPLDIIVFEPMPTDSAAAATTTYRMDMVMRHSSRFHISDMPIAVMIEDERGVIRTDTIIIRQSDMEDMETKVRYGVCETRLTLDPALRLSDGYAVTLTPIAERERTKGLLNVGIILTDSSVPPRSPLIRF